MATLSLVVVAKDEERTIGRVLDACKSIADEMILVDSGSTDRTKEIAADLGARVLHQDWLGYAAQKNFAISLASCDWILSLDADEVLTPQVVAEIARIKNAEPAECTDGYKIPRILFIGDSPVRHGGFFPDAQLRLFKKGTGKFKERMVHEAIKIDGTTSVLKHPMFHYAYPDVEGFERAMEKYARLSAEEYRNDGSHAWRANPINELIHPLWTFLMRYVLRLGFLDGALGLRLNLIYSDYVRKKIKYLRAEMATRK